MTNAVTKYQKFWADKTSAMGRGSTLDFYKLVAEEVRLLCQGRMPRRVLELGCGTGTLFEAMGPALESYKGVDFSPSMLDTFHKRHPRADLVEADASSYMDEGRPYDLILSHDVIEHFSPAMVKRHFRNARQMMHANSLLICAAIPWRALRTSYDRGFWFAGIEPSWRRWARSQVSRWIGRDAIGRWYRPEEIRRMARKTSLQSRFHGSLSHPYRFHAVLWKGGERSIPEIRPTGKNREI